MIAKGLKDPYAKLISADEFRTMQKYDMTGVGLNVGSSEEFYQKVARAFFETTSHFLRSLIFSRARFQVERKPQEMESG